MFIVVDEQSMYFSQYRHMAVNFSLDFVSWMPNL